MELLLSLAAVGVGRSIRVVGHTSGTGRALQRLSPFLWNCANYSEQDTWDVKTICRCGINVPVRDGGFYFDST